MEPCSTRSLKKYCQRLARPGAGGQHIAVAGSGGFNRLTLMTVQGDRRGADIRNVAFRAEYLFTFGVKQTLSDQGVDRAARGKHRVQ